MQIDLEALFRKMDDDLGFFKNFIEKLKSNSEWLFSEMDEAITAGDVNGLRSVAHAFKGILMICEAPELLVQLERIEKLEGEFITGIVMDNVKVSQGILRVQVHQLIDEMECFIDQRLTDENWSKG